MPPNPDPAELPTTIPRTGQPASPVIANAPQNLIAAAVEARVSSHATRISVREGLRDLREAKRLGRTAVTHGAETSLGDSQSNTEQ